MLFKCDKFKGGCDLTFEVNMENVEGGKYIQCPFCFRFIENPHYDEEKNNNRSYFG